MSIDPAVASVACLASAAIFAGSAAMKFLSPAEFGGAVENFRIVPDWMVAPTAWIVPILELIGAAAMLAAPTRSIAAVLLLSLIAVFSCAIAINLARGRRDIDCGCFGPVLRQRLSGWLMARNAVLAIMIVVADLGRETRTLVMLDYTTIASGAASIVILYAAANYLLASAPASAALRMRDA